MSRDILRWREPARERFVPYSQLDAIDIRILEVLQDDAAITNVELARRVGLTPSPCLARVRARSTSRGSCNVGSRSAIR